MKPPLASGMHFSQAPTLTELLQLKITENIGTKYKMFGTLLLKDDNGVRVSSIENEFRGNADRIITKILEEWLAGGGEPCSWQTLINTLRDYELDVLAYQVLKTKI